MPCNFISSCFFTESPWSRSANSNSGPIEGGPGGSGDFVTGRPRNNREGRLEINPAAQEDLPQDVEGGNPLGLEAGGDVIPDIAAAAAPPPVDQQPVAAAAGAAGRRMAGSTMNAEASANQANTDAAGTSPNNNNSSNPIKVPRVAKTFRAYLPSACHRTYSCVHCRAHLANHDELISKSFQGSQGRAYLFNSVVNIGCGPAEERVLLTGLHAVADIYCDCCKTTLGWKYEQAYESSQKYKEGKFIIELAHMIKENGWENDSV